MAVELPGSKPEPDKKPIAQSACVKQVSDFGTDPAIIPTEIFEEATLGLPATSVQEAPAVAEVLERSQAIAELSREIARAKAAIRSTLDAERVAATNVRVQRATEWVDAHSAEILRELAFAQGQIDQIKSCPASGKLSWMGKVAACTYWKANQVANQLSYFLVPVLISYTSEIVGLDAAGIQSMANARAKVMQQIALSQELLLTAQQSGASSDVLRLNLWISLLKIEKWTLPYLAGAGSQLWSGLKGVKQWFGKKAPITDEQRARNVAGRWEFVEDIGAGTADAYRSINLKNVRNNSYLMGDYLKRFLIVGLANTVINFVKAIPSLPYFNATPWYLIPNAGTMMLYQQEMASRKTDVATDRLPAHSWDELVSRVPGIIAGRTGFLHQSWARINTFLAGLPMEFPVLTFFTWSYLGMFGNIDPFSMDGVTVAGSKALSFLSLFGLYLVVKQAVWDKPVDLGFIAEWQGLASWEYEQELVKAAKKYDIPVSILPVVNPRTGETVNMERVTWRQTWAGNMWQQWRECFAVEGKPNLTYAEFTSNIRSGAHKAKVAKFKADLAKFKAFLATEDVRNLNNSPMGKRVRLQTAVEMTYRTSNVIFDTAIAILLAGGSTKELDAEKIEVPTGGE